MLSYKCSCSVHSLLFTNPSSLGTSYALKDGTDDMHRGSRAARRGTGAERKLCNRVQRDKMWRNVSFQVNLHVTVCFLRKEENNDSAQLQIKIFYWHPMLYKCCQRVKKQKPWVTVSSTYDTLCICPRSHFTVCLGFYPLCPFVMIVHF